MFQVSTADLDRTRLLLRLVAVVALIDVLLLVPLVIGRLGIVDSEDYKSVVGMTHGMVFMVLAALTALGLLQRRWNIKLPGLIIGANLILFGLLQAVDPDTSTAVAVPVGIVMAVLVVIPLTADILAQRELDATA
ncbi:MAG: DUF3817 domain-containing protein [Solirubrobacteraceae bacterium]